MHAASLVAGLSPPLDGVLLKDLLQEFLNAERRFVLRDWEPATLDGGQYAELAARIIYHVDSGNLNRRKPFDDCLQYVEDSKSADSHSFPERRAALHLCKVLRTLYKLRSQRGAIHIDPDYDANELDSSLIIALVRWIMSETLRVFWTGKSSEVAQAIREIVRYEVPAVLTVDGRMLVIRTDCTVEEEILLLLHNIGDIGLTSSEIVTSAPRTPSSVRSAISIMTSAKRREIVQRANGKFTLTPNSSKRVHEQLGPKLSLS